MRLTSLETGLLFTSKVRYEEQEGGTESTVTPANVGNIWATSMPQENRTEESQEGKRTG